MNTPGNNMRGYRGRFCYRYALFAVMIVGLAAFYTLKMTSGCCGSSSDGVEVGGIKKREALAAMVGGDVEGTRVGVGVNVRVVRNARGRGVAVDGFGVKWQGDKSIVGDRGVEVGATGKYGVLGRVINDRRDGERGSDDKLGYGDRHTTHHMDMGGGDTDEHFSKSPKQITRSVKVSFKFM